MSPRTEDTALAGGESAERPKRKPPVRRDLEKRRQQNIQAQRKYREKRRAHLNELEALAASAAQQNRVVELTPSAVGTSPSETIITEQTYSSSSAPSDLLAQSFLPDFDFSDVSSVPSSSVATPSDCLQRLISPEIENDTSSTALGVWDYTAHIDPTLLIRDKNSMNFLKQYWKATVNCGCSTPHVQIRTHGPDPSTYGQVRIFICGHGDVPASPAVTAATTPDPYTNHLRIDSLCTITALYTLGNYVGITEEMICDDTSISPFFRPSASPTSPENSLKKLNTVQTVQKIFKTLKPDLRPSTEQITTSHHPYIDILPFPTLRKNLIKYQHEIDEDEFFHDMLTGMVCWGGSGVGQRDRNNAAGSVSSGTPWDVRSWEAKPWVIRKYWKLFGGEEGELVRQSEWWRAMRGDDTLDVEMPLQI